MKYPTVLLFYLVLLLGPSDKTLGVMKKSSRQLRHSNGFSTRVWCVFFFCTELPWNDQFSAPAQMFIHVTKTHAGRHLATRPVSIHGFLTDNNYRSQLGPRHKRKCTGMGKESERRNDSPTKGKQRTISPDLVIRQSAQKKPRIFIYI